jgi:3-hydroxyethyl bacteriochlorophyllide a dehydrogenase
MDAMAVILEEPRRLRVGRVPITPPGDRDVVVQMEWSGISTGTERLLWSGRMPPFPGLGYPLVPGYESVGRVVSAGPDAGLEVGRRVFVPGARCFGEVRGLFGGAASRVVVPADRVTPIDGLQEDGVLLALAATAQHALSVGGVPDLVVGHGVLGRLIARLAVATGAPVTVWETNPVRAPGGEGYPVVNPEDDPRRDYARIVDVSGDPNLLDTLIARLAPRGEVVLAGFYSQPLSFSFPVAFMKEATLRVAAEWKPEDLQAVLRQVDDGRLRLGGLISHRASARNAEEAYRTAFEDASCIKMLLDWRDAS